MRLHANSNKALVLDQDEAGNTDKQVDSRS